MDPFSSFMTKKLGGKYVGPSERRGGRKREETPEAGADLDLDPDMQNVGILGLEIKFCAIYHIRRPKAQF